MKRLIVVFSIVLACAYVTLTQTDKRITEIRKIYDETNAQIAEMQKAPDLSSIFVVEMVVNKNLASYPAVGVYQSTATFYYTYGDREKEPYPNRLLKISVDLKRAANNGHFEYLFDPKGELISAFSTPDQVDTAEQRSYFSSGKLIKSIEDGKERDIKSKESAEASAIAKREAGRLAGIFKASLRK